LYLEVENKGGGLMNTRTKEAILDYLVNNEEVSQVDSNDYITVEFNLSEHTARQYYERYHALPILTRGTMLTTDLMKQVFKEA
jgi:hypothetical protein